MQTDCRVFLQGKTKNQTRRQKIADRVPSNLQTVLLPIPTDGRVYDEYTASIRRVYDELVFLQRDDPVLQEIVKWVESGARPSRNEIHGVSPEMGSMWSQFERLKLVNGVLCREYELENENTNAFPER